jgi:HEAT repeat protein
MQKRYLAGFLFLAIALILLAVVTYTTRKISRPQTAQGPQKVTQTPEQYREPSNTQIQTEPAATEATEEKIPQVDVVQAQTPPVKNELLQLEDEQSPPQAADEDLVVKAVLKALNKQLSPEDITESDLREAQTVVVDRTNSLKTRQQAAWDLATMGDAQSLDVLKELLMDPRTPAALKATIFEGLGYSYEPQAKELLLEGLEDDDETIVRAGIRGLGVLGDADSISILSDILYSQEASDSIVGQAAMALGGIEQHEAYGVLVNAYNDSQVTQRENLREDIISALGQRDISETADFLQQIVDDNPVGESLRVAAVEAVEDAQGDKSAFLLNNLHDPDSEVRAAAAWALAVDEEPAQVADLLGEMLVYEQDPEVRKRLYQAVANQSTPENESLTGLVLAEPDTDARLAGYDLLAQQLQNSESTEFAQQFDELVVPQLRETALTAKHLNQRLSAVISLKRAQTDESFLALERIAQESADARVVEAAAK